MAPDNLVRGVVPDIAQACADLFCVQLKPIDSLEGLLRKKQLQFYHRRAESLRILRRKPIKGYDVSLLLTSQHQQQLDKRLLIAFICQLMEDVSSCSSLKRLIAAHGRSSSLSLRKALA